MVATVGVGEKMRVRDWHHPVCMVDITRQCGEDKQVEVEVDSDEEEEYDDNDNVKINMDRLKQRTRRLAQEGAGNANANTVGANGAPSILGIGLGGGNGGGNAGTPPVNGTCRRQRPLLELSQEIWDRAKDVFEGTCFFGADAGRDELMAYHYML
jgi:hypothetical protein